MQRRDKRAERLILRATGRFSVKATFERLDGSVHTFEAFRSSPGYVEGTELGRRSVASYQWIVTKTTFEKLREFAGPDGLFNGEKIMADGDVYQLDTLTPFEALSLESGYRLNTYKLGDR